MGRTRLRREVGRCCPERRSPRCPLRWPTFARVWMLSRGPACRGRRARSSAASSSAGDLMSHRNPSRASRSWWRRARPVAGEAGEGGPGQTKPRAKSKELASEETSTSSAASGSARPAGWVGASESDGRDAAAKRAAFARDGGQAPSRTPKAIAVPPAASSSSTTGSRVRAAPTDSPRTSASSAEPTTFFTPSRSSGRSASRGRFTSASEVTPRHRHARAMDGPQDPRTRDKRSPRPRLLETGGGEGWSRAAPTRSRSRSCSARPSAS